MKLLALNLAVLVICHIRPGFSGFCSRPYTCGYTCYYTATTWYTCVLIFRCYKHVTRSQTCYSTCYSRVCCSGYTGSNCDIPVCSPPCSPDGSCISPNRCNCRQGFLMLADGRTCADINECAADNAGCQDVCTNTKGSFQCSCKEGYELTNDTKSCQEVDECEKGTSGCDHNCTNTVGSYTCSCQEGFQLGIDQKSCEDIDECATGAAMCEGYCRNTNGSYECACEHGWVLAPDGSLCTDINECLVDNGGCSHDCRNKQGSFKCLCPEGYELSANGKTCSEIDECIDGIAGCSQNCTNTLGSYRCSCREGYLLQEDGKTCSEFCGCCLSPGQKKRTDIDDCEGVVCQHGGSCRDGQNSYSCVCSPSFTSSHCESDVNECDQYNGGCQRRCVNIFGSFRCECSEGEQLHPNGFLCLTEDDFSEITSSGKGPEIDCSNKQTLTEPCFALPVHSFSTENNISMQFMSTSDWYQIKTDLKVHFTVGIVFVKVDQLLLPLSMHGLEVINNDGHFEISRSSSHNTAEGVVSGNIDKKPNCQRYEITPNENFEYLMCGTFLKSFLTSLFPSLPDWLSFDQSNSSFLSSEDMKSDLLWGKEVGSDVWCGDAPVFDDRLYSVFKFRSSFELNVLGEIIPIPTLSSSKKFCLIVDVCQERGGSLFWMIPEGYPRIMKRDIGIPFERIDVLKKLEERFKKIVPHDIGWSLTAEINSPRQSSQMELWNGDTMFSPIPTSTNMWIKGDVDISFPGKTVELDFAATGDFYLSVPSLDTALTSIFYDEWNVYFTVSASLTVTLKFRLFNEDAKIVLRNIATTKLDLYFSFGGGNRQWCGVQANPSGLYFSLILQASPFQGIYLLKEWVLALNYKVYAFVADDSDLRNFDLDINSDISAIRGFLSKLEDGFGDYISRSRRYVQDGSTVVQNIKVSISKMKDTLQSEHNNFDSKKQLIETTWKKFVEMKRQFDTIFTQSNSNRSSEISALKFDLSNLQYGVSQALNKLTEELFKSMKPLSGFGLKMNADITILGLHIGIFDIEIVHSTDKLLECSRFEKVRKLFQGEKATRVLGRASRGLRINTFFQLVAGAGLGGAVSEDKKFVFQVQLFVDMLGIKITCDAFLETKGFYFFLEGNVWQIFFAQLEVSATVRQPLALTVAGRFVADARKKRNIQTNTKSFEGSYVDGLKKAIQFIADEAQKRLESQTQHDFNKAQQAVSNAKSWLSEKQTEVSNAYQSSNEAVAALEKAKEALEAAKKPFEEALEVLRKAQRNVENLCRIRTCRQICIPGIKCKFCGGWIPFPCCQFTSCMISFPDPLCVVANAACYAIRAVAYVALEVVKIFVRIPMIAFDVAKLAVSAAQVVVDIKRLGIFVAEALLELAKIGLEVVETVLEAAKLALEAVKFAIREAAQVLSFVLEIGMKSIIDVRNCGLR